MNPLRQSVLLLWAASLPVQAWAQTYLFSIHADGSSQLPPVATSAVGEGIASLDWSTLTFTLDFESTGLSSPQTAANIHLAARGATGPVVVALPVGSIAGFSTKIDSVSAGELIAGRAYLSVSTKQNPNGEIRGQLQPATGLVPEPASIAPFWGALALGAVVVAGRVVRSRRASSSARSLTEQWLAGHPE